MLAVLASGASAVWAQTPFQTVPPDSTQAFSLPRCAVDATDRAVTRVCLSLGADSALVVVAERDSAETARWPYLGAASLLDLRAFALPAVDSTDTALVATLDAVSNGMGVAYWTATLLRDGTPTYRFRVEEFGEQGGSFALADGELVLWATEWVSGPDPAGQRGEGLYFTGRPFSLRAGALVPRPDLPVRARRFLESFARDDQGPAAWLRDERAETRDTDPALTGCTSISQTVTPSEVNDETDRWGYPFVRVVLDRPDAAPDTMAVGLPAYSDEVVGVPYVGDVATDRLFPPGYVPDLTPFVGQALRLETCAEGSLSKTRVLWVEAPVASP